MKALRTLMEENLASCGNIAAPHMAVYPWKGEIKNENEVAIFIKTSSDKKDKLVTRLGEIHPYELPCIMEIEASATSEYAAWLRNP